MTNIQDDGQGVDTEDRINLITADTNTDLTDYLVHLSQKRTSDEQ